MEIKYRGALIHIHIDANELSEGHKTIHLADGYTYERVFIHYLENINELTPRMVIQRGDYITFPVVNIKSPSTVELFIRDISKSADIRFSIEKFGQIPDSHYFDKAFEPILVTGDDGNEYNVIPSDQFK